MKEIILIKVIVVLIIIIIIKINNFKIIKISERAMSCEKQLVHSFEGHSRQVYSLCNHDSDKAILISAANDQTIRFWNFDTFHFLYLFRIGNVFSHLQLLTPRLFCGMHDNSVALGYINNRFTYICATETEVVSCEKLYSDFF